MPVPTCDSPAPTLLITGLIAGLMGVTVVVLTLITLFMVFTRKHKTSSPHYDYMVPSQSQSLPQRITLEGNGYDNHPGLTSTNILLQSNVAYGVPDRMGIDGHSHARLSSTTQPLQSNMGSGADTTHL